MADAGHAPSSVPMAHPNSPAALIPVREKTLLQAPKGITCHHGNLANCTEKSLKAEDKILGQGVGVALSQGEGGVSR